MPHPERVGGSSVTGFDVGLLTPEERDSLIATRTPDGGLHFDIRLQGEKETVFLVY